MQINSENLSNFDGVPVQVLDTYQLIRNKQYTDELQIKGALFDGKLEWLAGAFYLNTPDGTIGYDSDLSTLGVPNTPLGYSFYSEKSKALFANQIGRAHSELQSLKSISYELICLIQ